MLDHYDETNAPRSAGSAAPPIVPAVVANTPAGDGDDLFVTIPSFDDGRHRHGPCAWEPHATAPKLPTRGDRALLWLPVDHQLREGPWVLEWIPANPPVTPAPPVLNPTVAAGDTIAIPAGSTMATITGTATINSIVAGAVEQRVTLLFKASVTVTDGSNLNLAGSFAATADDTLTLVCDGVAWFETARSVN
jgi:hypothetical protein